MADQPPATPPTTLSPAAAAAAAAAFTSLLYATGPPYYSDLIDPPTSSGVKLWMARRSSQRPQIAKRWRPRRYITQDIKSVHVKPIPGVQSPESRFGPDVRGRIYANLRGFDVNDDEELNFFNDVETSDDDHDDDESDGYASDNTDNDSDSPGNGSGNGQVTEDDVQSVGSEAMASADPVPAGPSSQPSVQQGNSVPRVARARVNLTALSQQYNLYFAAYQSKIHVFRPQPAPEILRGPMLVLCPPATEAGRQVGGYMNVAKPHQVNHLIIGNLGADEILLLAYDDGDVIAYYTRHIVHHLECLDKRCRRKCPAPKVPQPFFRETVGMTAWGLAIHSQSRLIAVSSNLSEVNVFAFALQPPTSDDLPKHKTRPLDVPDNVTSPRTYSGMRALELESLLRLRDRPWRILLPLGRTGHNIPCLDFIDDEDGVAEKVAAIDINGSIYILDIWKVGSRPLKIPSQGRQSLEMGWGISIIPTEMILPTARMPRDVDPRMLDRSNNPNIDGQLYFSKINELANMRPEVQTFTAHDMTNHEPDLDSETSMEETMDLHVAHDGVRITNEALDSSSDNGDEHESIPNVDEKDDLSEELSSDEDLHELFYNDPADDIETTGTAHSAHRARNGHAASFAYNPATMPRHWDALLKYTDRPALPAEHNLKKALKTPFSLAMIICPSIGLTWNNLSLPRLLETLKDARVRQEYSKEITLLKGQPTISAEVMAEVKHMARRFVILRTFVNTVEIVSIEQMDCPFFIRSVMEPPTLSPMTLWDLGRDFHRCSLLHVLPEISLIIVGNMFGSVVLIRPIEDIQPRPLLPVRGFRIEWTLPFVCEKSAGKRPPCCLLGTAVSPLPEPSSGKYGLTSKKRGRLAPRVRRYRLILHYMDHTILQYYIEGSKPDANKLRVGVL